MNLSAITVIILLPGLLTAGCISQSTGHQFQTNLSTTSTTVTIANSGYPCEACNDRLPGLPPSVTITSDPTKITLPITTSGPVSIPIAQFSGEPTTGKTPLTVRFTDLSTGQPSRWVWDFGDNNSSAGQNPVHVYTSSGTYTVLLISSNIRGSDSEKKIYYIMVIPAFLSPGAAYDVIPPTTTQPATVQFVDRSSGPPTNWSWDFGDGGSSDLQNPEHTYPGPGTYIVSLKVANPSGEGIASGYVILPLR